MITLDCPTCIENNRSQKTFYDQVIKKLVDIQHEPKDNVYQWLKVMFSFCAGKPFVYYSRYVPSAKIVKLARRYDIRFLWRPLTALPGTLVERHRTWRQLWLSEGQWATLSERLANPRANIGTLQELIS